MPPVFLATLGQRPEAITMAIDALDARFHYSKIAIIHTDPERSKIKKSYRALKKILLRDYAQHTVDFHEITHPDDSSLIDIDDLLSAEAYYRGMVEILRDYRLQYEPIHLLISGGRKSMSVYATLAATLLFGEYDLLWTSLVDVSLMQDGMFHAPPGELQKVTVVQMPLPISRLIPGEIARQSVDELTQRISPRQKFLSRLTASELALAQSVTQQPYTSNRDLAIALNKNIKTFESQMSSIYGKLLESFDLTIDNKHKRQVLLDVMAGRV